MYLIESLLLHFAINDYITVTCGLLSFFTGEDTSSKRNVPAILLLTSLLFFRVCLTEVTGLIVSRPLVGNIGLAYVAFMSLTPQRFKSITYVVKYSLTQGGRKAI